MEFRPEPSRPSLFASAFQGNRGSMSCTGHRGNPGGRPNSALRPHRSPPQGNRSLSSKGLKSSGLLKALAAFQQRLDLFHVHVTSSPFRVLLPFLHLRRLLRRLLRLQWPLRPLGPSGPRRAKVAISSIGPCTLRCGTPAVPGALRSSGIAGKGRLT